MVSGDVLFGTCTRVADADHLTLESPTFTMSSKTPNSQHEAPNLPEPSSTAGPSSRKRARVYHTASTGLDILGNVSEASDILSPLKAACRATKSILDVVQAVDDNQEEWNDLTQRLEGYMSAIDDQIDAFEKYSPAERAVDDALSQSLAHYVKLLGEFHDKVRPA